MFQLVISRFKAPRPLGVVLILAVCALALVVGPSVASAASVAQGEIPPFVLPAWFLGLVPTIVWLLNAVIFKAIESGTGKELDSTAKRIIVIALSLAIVAGLILSGSVALPAPIPSEPDPLAWGAWVLLLAGYAWAGATMIYALIEAGKGALGVEKAKLPA